LRHIHNVSYSSSPVFTPCLLSRDTRRAARRFGISIDLHNHAAFREHTKCDFIAAAAFALMARELQYHTGTFVFLALLNSN